MLLLFMQPSLHGAALKPENGASWAHVLRADGASIGDLCCWSTNLLLQLGLPRTGGGKPCQAPSLLHTLMSFTKLNGWLESLTFSFVKEVDVHQR